MQDHIATLTTPAKPSRRWLRFSLRTLFWLTLLVAILLFGMNERRERQRIEADAAALRIKLEDAELQVKLWHESFLRLKIGQEKKALSQPPQKGR